MLRHETKHPNVCFSRLSRLVYPTLGLATELKKHNLDLTVITKGYKAEVGPAVDILYEIAFMVVYRVLYTLKQHQVDQNNCPR